MKTRGLGKGLSALMEESEEENLVKILPLESLNPGVYQPRKKFHDNELRELADSIAKNGLLLPIIARKYKGNLEIVAGERRWRASKIAGLSEIPVIIKELSDQDALELALVENVQRQDLTAIEKAEAFLKLIEEFNYTQDELAKNIGKTRTYITNLLRLLKLPAKIQSMINEGSISMGHARALIEYEEAENLAEKIVREGLSVRQTEEIVRKDKNPSLKKEKITIKKDSDIEAIEESISRFLGMTVKIENTKNGGRVIINFSNLNQLDMILKKLNEE